MAKAISGTLQKAASKYADTLQEIKDEFAKRCQADKEISSLLARIQSGSGSYEDASEASRRIGSELSRIYTQKMRDAYNVNISAGTDEIDEILRQTLKHDYETITDLSKATQENLNKTAGINMKAVAPEYNVNRTEGIISRVDEFSQRNLDAAMNELETNMVNYSMSVVDDSVKANAEYQFKAGMVPKIKRIMHGFKPCKWCQALAGTYEYPDVPNDVYRRHQNCYCTVTYTPVGSKRSQDVWSKKWGKERDFEIEQRKRAADNEKRKREKLDENRKVLLKKINSGEVTLTLNKEKQNDHMEATHKDGKSYSTIPADDLQGIINKKAGTGEIYIKVNGQIKEVIDAGRDVGYNISTRENTNRITVHYSKTRTHAVPARRIKND